MNAHPQNRPLFVRWEFRVEDTYNADKMVSNSGIPQNAINERDRLNKEAGAERYKVTSYSFSRA